MHPSRSKGYKLLEVKSESLKCLHGDPHSGLLGKSGYVGQWVSHCFRTFNFNLSHFRRPEALELEGCIVPYLKVLINIEG